MIKKKLTYLTLLSIILLGFPNNSYSEEVKQQSISSVSTMAEVYQIFNETNLELILETDVGSKAQDILNNNLFVPLSLHIDLNVIGRGKTIQINQSLLKNFISSELIKENIDLPFLLVEHYKKGDFNIISELDLKQAKSLGVKNSWGGFFVGESEYHQEPDGKFAPLLEINQLRLYFSSQINQSSSNSMYFLGEWNPIPEEAVHHIDEIILNNNGKDQRITLPQQKVLRPIPFEQLFLMLIT